MLPHRPLLDKVVDCALEEDLGSGDLTSAACIAPNASARAVACARQDLVVSGGPIFARVFARLGGCDVTLVKEDGAHATFGEELFRVQGEARAVLAGERTALNFVQRMSGVATLTARYVAEIPKGARTRICDTRKTTPGLRALERYAVRCGGGHNHRDHLGAAVLIKDNHIAWAGGVRAAIESAKAYAPHTSRVACEVDTLVQLEEALSARADIVLLDNMSTPMIEQAMKMIAGRALVEVSGGITLARIRELATLGVHAISVGALTHSAPAADLGLDVALHA